MTFDIEQIKKPLRELMIAYCRNMEFASAQKENYLGNGGRTILSTAIECRLVGFFDQAEELLRKARLFLCVAIDDREIPRVYGKGITECHRASDFALCVWLLDRRHNDKLYEDAARWSDVWFENSPKTAKEDIQLALTEYLEAGQYERVIERFEWAGSKKPANLRQIQGEGSMCYVIARERLGLEYTREDIDAALATFLERHMSEWLGWQGRVIDAARWVKRAHWQPGDDPTATLLRAYDYLADVEPPEFPHP